MVELRETKAEGKFESRVLDTISAQPIFDEQAATIFRDCSIPCDKPFLQTDEHDAVANGKIVMKKLN